MDFIEPVYEIKLDFEKEECDFGEYGRRIAYIKGKSEKDENDAISAFKSEIWNSFAQGDVNAVRKLYDVIFIPQDCTGCSSHFERI